jgi:flagellar basal-body rod protein FlgC
MSLLNIFEIAGTALTAQSARLDAVSSNMANAQVVASSPEEAYRARLPVFAAIFKDGFDTSNVAGVEMRELAYSKVPIEKRHQPGHPMANEEGYVFEPNVNMVEEMTNMISASKSYTSNVEIMNTSKQLLQRTLSIGGQ